MHGHGEVVSEDDNVYNFVHHRCPIPSLKAVQYVTVNPSYSQVKKTRLQYKESALQKQAHFIYSVDVDKWQIDRKP